MIPCPKCKDVFISNLTDWTTCPNCGRAWELNEDKTAVKTVNVHIEKVTVRMNARKLMNGVKDALSK